MYTVKDVDGALLVFKEDKHVGYVSDGAKWVKDGYIANENDVEAEHSSNDKRSKHIEIGDPVYFKDARSKLGESEGVLEKIEHVYEDACEWEDIFIIKDVRFAAEIFRSGEVLYAQAKNVSIERKDVRFKPTYFTVYKFRCPMCETFH